MSHSLDVHDSWPELSKLIAELVDTRARIAELHAHEATLFARALDMALERIEDQRGEGRPSDLVIRMVSAEIGAALRVSDRTVQARLGHASTLVSDYPGTLAALQCGSIDRGHAMAIVEAGMALRDADARARFEQHAIPVAQAEGIPRTRVAARAIAASIDPESTQVAMERALRDRSVRVYDLPAGMARLMADLPAHLAYAIYDRLTRNAHQLCGPHPATITDAADVTAARAHETDEPAVDPVSEPPGPPEDPVDDRSMDELRADILSDTLLTSVPTAHGDPAASGAIRGRVQVTVPVLTLAGVSDEPALLAGYGPIPADVARELARDAAGWDRVMTHPHTGLPMAVDRYRPSAELRRFLAARDEHCRFPGCRLSVWRCDIDHTVAASDGGATSAHNLADFCKRHHILKHETAWTVRQLPGGILEWTSPTGRIYLDRPAPTVRFVPSGGPPPL